jgi:hypothetical protein
MLVLNTFSPILPLMQMPLDGGWYNTAKPHKLFGFDFTTSVNLGIVPSSENTFDVAKIDPASPFGTGKASTIAGPNTSIPLTYKDKVSGLSSSPFNSPPGADWKYVPAPTAQIGLGLPFGTELKLRFIPKINFGGKGDIRLFGIGAMHSLLQYLPGYKLMKLWDVSAFVGYTKLKANAGINIKPDSYTNYSTTVNSTYFENQSLSASFTSMNFGLVGSINIPVLTLYGGLGYCSTKTEIKLKGRFPTPTTDLAHPGQLVYVDSGVYGDAGNIGAYSIKKFPSIEIKNLSGVRANIGLRIKLAILTIHADYTLAQYNMLTAGLGLSFR